MSIFCALENSLHYKINLYLKNWSLASNFNVKISIFLQREGAFVWYFFNLSSFNLPKFIVWNIKGLRNEDAKIWGLEN